MKLLLLDNDGEGVGVDLALRAQAAAHEVHYWTPPKSGPYADGMVDKVAAWEPEADWADLIVTTGNSQYIPSLTPYFAKGYPIFGCNAKSAELELDREHGQATLEKYGIKVVPYHAVDSIDEAIDLVVETGEAYAIKPWGGEADKAMTCVARDADEAIFMLERWKQQGLKGKLMLQEKIDGVEMGISGFFGPGGWSAALEESFEHKKFMNDDLGCNTGEMGTVIRHVFKSKLFDQVLEPLTDYLHECNYVGDCSVNCIIDDSGAAWPLEFTMRLGWPDFCIRQAVIQGDPVEWMLDLVEGKDTLEISTQVAVGVLLAHGDFPTGHDPSGTWEGFPIKGTVSPNVHYQQVMYGRAPTVIKGDIKLARSVLSAGNYLMVCTGVGETVKTAQTAAYAVVDRVKMPSNLMYRTDVGDRLKSDLPALQKHGYAVGMKWA